MTNISWFDFIAGLASIVSLFLAFYYRAEGIRTDKVIKSFYNAISSNSKLVLHELEHATEIKNSVHYDKLQTQVESCKNIMANLDNTINSFKETLWNM